VGLSGILWVAIVDCSRPRGFPGRPGLVLGSEEPERWPSEVERFFNTTPTRLSELELNKLGKIDADRETKVKLVKWALNQSGGTLPDTLSVGVLAWMAALPGGRYEAFQRAARVNRQTFTQWLEQLDSVTLDELTQLKEGKQLNHVEHGEIVADLLRRTAANGFHDVADPFTVYYQLFPQDPTLRVNMLDEKFQRVWNGLLSDYPGDEPPRVPLVQELFERLRAFQAKFPFTLAGLAWAAQNGVPEVRALFRQRLIDAHHLPEAAARVLVDDEVLPLPAGMPVPRLQPVWDWLRAINPYSFVRCYVREWHEWWGQGFKEFRSRGLLTNDEVFEEGLRSGNPDLLRALRAPRAVCELANAEGARVSLAGLGERDWDPRANALLAQLSASGELWKRIEPLTREGWDWLIEHLDDAEQHARVQRWCVDLYDHAALDADSLCELAPALSGTTLLPQIDHLARQPYSVERNRILAELLHEQAFDQPAKRQWLAARLLRCESLPVDPAWSAEELLLLGSVLGMTWIEQTLRIVFSQKKVENAAAEGRLLADLLPYLEELLENDQVPHLSPPDGQQYAVRPGWIEKLAGYFGWPPPAVGAAAARRASPR
jgi:hypothetical protein